ncbi:MAG TPA: HAMP domain-containing sensor histidine kinase, partial [Blastocatellia bacterium]|nr:HAMP domain-containing sensor histidine kinase [Blastocatellia bacterium]
RSATMKMKRSRFWAGNKRFRLLLTLELAVMLPAAALIYVNFDHLNSVKRGKNLEAAIHRDFQYMLSDAEKEMTDRIYKVTEEVRGSFPSPDVGTDSDKGKKLEMILSQDPRLVHIFFFDADKGFLYRTQQAQMSDAYFRGQHEHMSEMYRGWFSIEGKLVCKMIREKTRLVLWYPEKVERPGCHGFMTTALFVFPQLSVDRVVLGGVSFDPDYLRQTFFPAMFEELIAQKMTEDRGDPLALAIFSKNPDDQDEARLAASAGWGEGKPEVMRNLEGAFRELTLGIKFQGTSAGAIATQWLRHSLFILGALSLLMIGGLVLAYKSVSKEIDLARLKSDFVSNVSHELRTPLSLIQLYAETLELGRISTQEKKEEYYRIIRKESERLGKLISNILDFSRIEAGRKEYDLRETDIAELVRNTMDTYRYQIEKNGFEFEMSIDSDIPAMRLDREAITRALLNLVNNAIKYSADVKFLLVKLYRSNGVVKLEVVDRGIGIPRREQAKIFEKFYRTCDPLVHNTKGSGLGLSLVQHITHAHGGQVEVESTPGKGSKFTLSFPLTGYDARQANGLASGASAS